MHTQSSLKSLLSIAVAMFAAIKFAIAGPPSLAGTYHETGKTAKVTIVDLGGGKYEIRAPHWTGFGFWDDKEQCYEGIYRYPGEREDVGHQRIVRVSSNVLAVSWRISMIGNGGGTYQLERIESAKQEVKKPTQ